MAQRLAQRAAMRLPPHWNLLAGAGASWNSGLPTATELMMAVLQRLGLPRHSADLFLSWQLPFEAFIEALASVASVQTLLELFHSGRPNRNHRVVCDLVASGVIRTVITTNFDTLIETALSERGLTFASYTSDLQLRRFKEPTGGVSLLKLHGDVAAPEELAATIRRVARQQGVVARRLALESALASTQAGLLVLGYSFSDRFDISPALAALRNMPAYVLYVCHQSRSLEPRLKPLSTLGSHHPLFGYPGDVLECHTDDFVSAVGATYFGRPIGRSRRAALDWVRHVDSWALEAGTALGSCAHLLLLGVLHKAAGRWKTSNRYLLRALSTCHSREVRVAVFQALGDNHRDLQALPQASYWLRRAQTTAIRIGDRRREARALASKGIVAADRKRFATAAHQYRKALRLASAVGDTELVGKCAGNIGIAYKNVAARQAPAARMRSLERAMDNQRMAIRIARRLGDKRSEGRSLGNLAIAYSDAGNHRRAFALYPKALAIAQDLGDALHTSIWQANWGKDLAEVDSAAARSLIMDAMRGFGLIPVSRWVKECREYLRALPE